MKKFFTVFRMMVLGALMLPMVSCEKEEGIDKDSHPTVVDLGLSVKWASCNVGADSPEEYGDYFAWGETETKSNYSHLTYSYWDDKDGDGWYEDEGEFVFLAYDISGTKYDAAHAKWGDGWRMPTEEEFVELEEKCTWKWTAVNGVSGALVTGPNGNSIFLPASGERWQTSNNDEGVYGNYWSGSSITYPNVNMVQMESNAIGLSFDFDDEDGEFYLSSARYIERYIGCTIRPVMDK